MTATLRTTRRATPSIMERLDARPLAADDARGQVSILDRRVSRASCECYERIRSEYSRLVPLN